MGWLGSGGRGGGGSGITGATGSPTGGRLVLVAGTKRSEMTDQFILPSSLNTCHHILSALNFDHSFY